ncbi:MAG: type II toxin-antitoxin system HicB family antitoxin, partial [Cetobacterium sp.]
MKDIFIFPAVFSKDEDGFSVYFPNFEGAFTCADTFEEAVFMAKDCLELNLDGI